MKADKFFGVLIIIAFILIGLVYAQFMQQGQVTGKNIKILEDKVNEFDRALKKVDLEVRGSDEVIKGIDGEVRSAAIERKDMVSKIESLAKDIEALQNDVKGLKSAKEVNVSLTPAQEPAEQSVLISEPAITAEEPLTTPDQPEGQ